MPHHPVEVPVLSDALRAAPLSLVTRAADFVFVSGIPPFSAETGQLVTGDIRTQAVASLASVRACLRAAGADLSDVVNVRIYCANTAWYATVNEVYLEVFAGHPLPTRTFVPVASWPLPFDLEIDCVAYTG